MILMPYVNKLIKSGVPISVILLVLINAFVYFGPETYDARRFERNSAQYVESILPKIELPRYVDYLKTRREVQKARRIESLISRQAVLQALSVMQNDEEFMKQLRGDRIITQEDDNFEQWRGARIRFDSLFETRFVERFEFKSAAPSALTALTHQFLHADAGHLLGNMLTLILIAPAVEALIGTRRFLLGYLAGGLGAVAAFWAWRLHMPPTALIGASGAVSAAMGMFAVLFGLRRIPFFYFVVVYFDIVRAPALLALPIWLANEALQLFWLGQGNVAYDAHFGGLLTGAAIACLWRRPALLKLMEAEGEISTPQPTKEPLERARRMMGAQRFDAARRNYARAAKATENCHVLRECWNVVGLAPTTSPEYHTVAIAILRQESLDPEISNLVTRVFDHYRKNARPMPKISPNMLAKLAQRFLHMRQPAELEVVLRLMRNVAPTHPLRAELTKEAMLLMSEEGEGMRAKALENLL